MKKLTFSMLLLFFITSYSIVNAQENEDIIFNNAEIWLCTDAQIVNNPMLNTGANIAGKTFKATDFFEIIKTPDKQRAANGRKLFDTPQSMIWKESTEMPNTDNINNEQYAYTYMAGYLENIKYQEVKLKAESSSPYELYLDGEKIISYDIFCQSKTKDKRKSTSCYPPQKHWG